VAGSVNKVILVGHLGRDPETRLMQNGDKCVTLSVATSESWKDKGTGERKERTEWHKVVIWNERLGEVAEDYLRKGAKVYLEGSLQTRKWMGNDGVEKYTTEVVLQRFRGEIVLLDKRGDGVGNGDVVSRPATVAGFGHQGAGTQILNRIVEQRAPSGPPAAPRDNRPEAGFDEEIPFLTGREH